MRRLVALLLCAAVALAHPVTDAADKVLELFGGKGDLKELAARDDPDPWLVADELCARGEHDAAEAFAKAAPRPDTERLLTYVAGMRPHPADPAARRALAAANEALVRKDAKAAIVASDGALVADDVTCVRLLLGRGLALRALHRLGESAGAFLAAAETAERLGWLRGAATALNESGRSSHQRSDFRAALICWERHLAVEEARGCRSGIARALGNVGNAHCRLGNHPKALEYQERALKLAEESGDRACAATSLGNIGAIHHGLGDYPKALEYYDRAARLSEELGDREGVARTVGNAASIHYSLGEYSEALRCHERALKLKEALEDRAGLAGTLNNIGLVHFSLGNCLAALECHDRALQLAEETGDRLVVAMAIGNTGTVHHALGDYPRALGCQERSLRLGKELGDRAVVARALGNLGLIYSSLGEYRRALECADQHLKESEELGDRAVVAQSLGNLALAYRLLGDHPKALGYYERSLRFKEELSLRAGIATVLSNIGNIHHDLGNYPKALEYQERALKLAEALGDRLCAAHVLINIGNVHSRLGDYTKALECGERARAAAAQIGALPIEIGALLRLARVLFISGRPGDAAARAREAATKLTLIGSGLAEDEGASAREQFVGIFDVGAHASLVLDDAAGVAYFLESGRAATLVEWLGGRARLMAAAVPAELQRADIDARARERSALARYRRALDAGDPVEALWKEVEAAREGIVAVARRMRREAKAQADLVCPEAAPLGEIQGALREGETLVLFALFEKEALALLVTPKAARVARLGDPKEIEGAAGALGRAAVRPDARGVAAAPHEGFEYLAKRLRRLVIEPLALDAGTTRLLLSPDGPLSYVPFAVLTEKEVVYVPSGTTCKMLREEPPTRGSRVLAVGDPDYAGPRDATATMLFEGGEKLEPLPASREEAKAVGDVVLLGKQATVPGLREALAREPRWRAVHLACHGLVDPDRPVLSSLALAATGGDDGFLKCLDVYRMRIPADLVVLSACETAQGKVYRTEGVMGWTRAFMFAGAPRVLVSLWKVDDEATRALMEAFYAEWKGGKLGAAAALRKAQEQVKSQEKWKHPYFWAAWQLWGLAD